MSAVALFGGSTASAGPLPPIATALQSRVVAVQPAPPDFMWVAYKYPTVSNPDNEWHRAIATGAGQSFVVNAANGPGKRANPDYQWVIGRARAAGIGLLGYVYTDYGARPLASVKADVDRWRGFYGIGSIFLDEAAAKTSISSTDRKLIDYYSELHSYIHTRGGSEVLNPGVVPDQEYLGVADSIVTFEGSAAKYRTTKFPRWTVDAPDRKVTHIVYGATAAEEAELVDRAHMLGAEHIGITDDTLPNPYDSLPSYYETERTQIHNLG